jgi:MoaA/NifB/PqqE/SkfB family radical SAM enzyme
MHSDEMIINIYKGIRPKIKAQFEKRFPLIYEKCIKQIAAMVADRKRAPEVRACIEKIAAIKPFPLFSLVEIETINRCNNTCTFCPVNRNADTRPFRLMDRRLFISIMEQLRELGYAGKVGLFSNNEPLLDDRISEFAEITRKYLPGAFISILTNGLLLTVEKLNTLMKYIDELAIDNYEDNLELVEPVREIRDYCIKNKVYRDKIKIWLRRKDEVLTNRAGQARNRSKIRRPLRSSCSYPFMQLVVRPDGKVSLCCNDALGQMTMGDLTAEKIIDVWHGERFRHVRECLLKGRRFVSLCGSCDNG